MNLQEINLQEKVVWRNLNIFQKVPISAQASIECDANRTLHRNHVHENVVFWGSKT
jgi:hypothetical protein